MLLTKKVDRVAGSLDLDIKTRVEQEGVIEKLRMDNDARNKQWLVYPTLLNR